MERQRTPETKTGKTGFRSFAAVRHLKNIMAGHFRDLDEAARDENRKVAWCTSVGPAELLRSMGMAVFFPENHAAMIGASRSASRYIPLANAHGYSPDICSYLTSDIGAFLSEETPISKTVPGVTSVPRPDILVYNTNQCRDVKDWFSWYARRFRVPCIGVESFCNVDTVSRDHVRAVSRQMEALVPHLETVTGEKFDIDRLRETVEQSRLCSRKWREVLETAVHRPSPFTFFDGVIHMGPAVVARGTAEAVAYYDLLLDELRQRIRQGEGAVSGERYRIYWEGMPVWGKLRDMSALLSGSGVCASASTYCNSWIFDALDPDDPFDSMAGAYTELFIVRSDTAKEAYIADRIRQYGIDGVIFHEAKTCPNNSNSRYGMPRRIGRELNIPVLVIQGDLNDLRLFSMDQTATRIEAFVEQIESAGHGAFRVPRN